MLRFAANLSTLYDEFDFLDRFAAAARDGFGGVEVLFPYAYSAGELAIQLEEHGLDQVLINAPPGDWAAGERGLACLPNKEMAFRESIETALAFAHTLRCPRVHVMAGVEPADVERAALRARMLENLAWAADRAAAAQVLLLIEPINRRDLPGYFLNLQEEAHALVREVGSPWLKVQMDLYHCQIVEGDVSVKLRQYLGADASNVGHIQIASIPERNEPDSGELDYAYVLRLIEELGYKNWIGCEYRPRAGTSSGLGWLRKLARQTTR